MAGPLMWKESHDIAKKITCLMSIQPLYTETAYKYCNRVGIWAPIPAPIMADQRPRVHRNITCVSFTHLCMQQTKMVVSRRLKPGSQYDIRSCIVLRCIVQSYCEHVAVLYARYAMQHIAKIDQKPILAYAHTSQDLMSYCEPGLRQLFASLNLFSACELFKNKHH